LERSAVAERTVLREQPLVAAEQQQAEKMMAPAALRPVTSAT
jgi:hypothetical protein